MSTNLDDLIGKLGKMNINSSNTKHVAPPKHKNNEINELANLFSSKAKVGVTKKVAKTPLQRMSVKSKTMKKAKTNAKEKRNKKEEERKEKKTHINKLLKLYLGNAHKEREDHPEELSDDMKKLISLYVSKKQLEDIKKSHNKK